MAEQFIGSMVSIDCGDILGVYQGLLDSVCTSTQALTIIQAYRNGMKCQVPRITISACDIRDLKIVKDAQAARVCNVTTNVHVKQHSGIEPSNKSSQDPAKTDCQELLVNGLKTININRDESSNLSSSRPAGPSHSPHVKKISKADPVPADLAYTVSADDAKKNTMHNVTGAVSRYSPSRRIIDPSDLETGRLQPVSKSNGTRMKSSRNMSPINNVNGVTHSSSGGAGFLRRNDHSMPNVEGDHYSAARKRTTSASDTCSVQKNGLKGANNKLADRHGLGGNCIRENDCFSMPVDSFVSDEFDFEKNLAMFDKRAVFDEIERDLEQFGGAPSKQSYATNSMRPAEVKYRCDENVLPTLKTTYRQITVSQTGEASISREYVTDSGLVIPGVQTALRDQLFQLAEQSGYASERRIEMAGRSAAEMVLQLLGGGSRFDPKNSHQRPRVVVLCGSGHQSAIGINCARHLAARSIFVTLLQPDSVLPTAEMKSELQLADLGSNFIKISCCNDLPRKPVDMIISALDNHCGNAVNAASWYVAAVEWANHSKAPVLAIDPPVGRIGVNAKWSIAVALPLSYDESCGQIYLCDLGLPQKLYHNAGLSAYQSPFAHKFIIPLYGS